MNLISKLFLVFYVSFFNYLYSDHGERKTQLLSTYETGLFEDYLKQNKTHLLFESEFELNR